MRMLFFARAEAGRALELGAVEEDEDEDVLKGYEDEDVLKGWCVRVDIGWCDHKESYTVTGVEISSLVFFIIYSRTNKNSYTVRVIYSIWC